MIMPPYCNWEAVHQALDAAEHLHKAGLGTYHLSVYVAIARHVNKETGVAFPSYAKIAQQAMISRSSAIVKTDDLVSAGFLTKVSPARAGQGSNTFRMVLPKDQSTPVTGPPHIPVHGTDQSVMLTGVVHGTDWGSPRGGPHQSTVRTLIDESKKRTGEEKESREGGAGGKAPAPEATTTALPSFLSLKSNSNGNTSPSPAQASEIAPSPATKTPAQPGRSLPAGMEGPREIPGQRPRRAAAVTPHAAPHSVTSASPPVTEPWHPLDALMSLFAANLDAERAGAPASDYHGHNWRSAGRAVFRAFCDDDSMFWPGRVHTEADLTKHLPKMMEQTPADYRIPGSAVNPLPVGPADPNCSLCRGSGGHHKPDPSREALRGSLPDHWVDQPRFTVDCVCRISSRDLRPWRKFKKSAAA